MDEGLIDRPELHAFIGACHRINQALLATLGGRFPVFIVPAENVQIDALPADLTVTITWDQGGWYVNQRTDGKGQRLFSFDIPEELFKFYANGNQLDASGAIDLKEQYMSKFQAVRTLGNELKIIRFVLEPGWLTRVREELRYRQGIR